VTPEFLEQRLTPSITFDGSTVRVGGSELADTVIVFQLGNNVQFSVVNANGYESLTLPRSAVQAVSTDLLGGNDLYLNYSNVSEVVNGGGGNDVLFLGRGNAFCDAGDGDDAIHGGTGFGSTQVLVGGAGRDTIWCGFGSDVIVGHNPDEDRLISFGAYGMDLIVG